MLNSVERDLDEQLDAMLLAGEAGDDEVIDGNIVGDPEDTADDDADVDDDDEFEDADTEDEDQDGGLAHSDDLSKD